MKSQTLHYIQQEDEEEDDEDEGHVQCMQVGLQSTCCYILHSLSALHMLTLSCSSSSSSHYHSQYISKEISLYINSDFTKTFSYYLI